MSLISRNSPGKEVLLMGNEAIARGALEAGISVATAYPGNPSSEIIGSLADVAREMGIYVEWSVNEKVALEVAAAAALSELNALVAMKQNGLNVASDFLLNLNLTGIRGGLVLVVCDDPSGISSTNEEDSRIYAKLADLPLLEPSAFHEAKDMVKYAFDLSRRINNVCIVRSVTRISHARGNVILGPLPESRPVPHFDTTVTLSSLPPSASHPVAHRRLREAGDAFELSDFNTYSGPDFPELLVITCGSGRLFALEAINLLNLEERVGLLSFGTTWPLPEGLLLRHLGRAGKVLFLEEIDPFLENNVKGIYADHCEALPRVAFFGKKSGDVPDMGELSPGLVMGIISRLTAAALPKEDPRYAEEAQDALDNFCPPRSLAFCPGCPHRASFWAIKKALALDGRDGVLFGDIGCYGLGFMATGFHQSKTLHAMGSGVGMSVGFGLLESLGATQPSLTVCGDSTFFHAAIPALINGLHHKSNFLMMVLDNSATAMTGFQPHPGSPVDAMGYPAPPISIENLCASLGVQTVIQDPFELEETSLRIHDMLRENGTKVLILRQECALFRSRTKPARHKVRIIPEQCIGEECGCNRLCTRVFRCPALIWDRDRKKSSIDEALCVGCGVCAQICPSRAILREET